MLLREQPDISITVDTSAYTSEDLLDLRSIGFKTAFGVLDYKTRQSIYDESRFEWHVYLEKYKNLQLVEKVELKVDHCSEEDYNDFFPVESQS